MPSRSLTVVALLVAAVAAAGCGSSTQATTSKDTLSVAVNSAVTTVDPAFACTT